MAGFARSNRTLTCILEEYAMKKTVILFCILALLLSGCGCRPGDLMANIPARAISVAEVPEGNGAATDFSLRLFQKSFNGAQNTLVSPLSVLMALGMTANGAEGETLNQMEQALGLPRDSWNGWLYAYKESQSDALKLANSIWFTDDPDFSVERKFLETNADFYQAGLYQTTFDQNALAAINDWVKKETDGMIPEILDEIPEDAVMYLINALSFEAQWEEVYREDQVWEGAFTREDGMVQTAQLMYSQEGRYLEDEKAKGFLKYYEGKRYAFAALLPKEGVTVADYVAGLTGEHLRELLENPEKHLVSAGIPKFETDFAGELSGVLKDMGMTNAFDYNKADFSSLGSYTGENIFISRVLHKTAISVAEQGTKAGAATAVELETEAAEMNSVVLDRPFVYLLIDCENNIPFFIGALMDVEG